LDQLDLFLDWLCVVQLFFVFAWAFPFNPGFFFKKKNGIGQCNCIISLKKIVKNTHKHIKITQKN
jgi:hypothetical protein